MRIILFSAIACAIAFAQTPDSQVAFEVATVKPSAPAGLGRIRIGNRGGPGTEDPGRFTCDRCNLSMLVSTAYDLNVVQISGPSWLTEPQFDVTAKVPEGATKAQFRIMMQNLLIERFKLAAHREKKDLPADGGQEGVQTQSIRGRARCARYRRTRRCSSSAAADANAARCRRLSATPARPKVDDDHDAGACTMARGR